MARSFERIRSIVRKKRVGCKDKADSEPSSKLGKLVNDIVIKRREEKKYIGVSKGLLEPEYEHGPIYSKSYQVIYKFYIFFI